MSQCVAKLPHSCGTEKGLQVFTDYEGKLNGFCFACNTFVQHPYGKPRTVEDIEIPEPKSPEEIEQDIKFIKSLKARDVKQRKLRGEDLEFFGVKVGLSEQDGETPNILHFPVYKENKHTGYYVKSLNPDFKATWAVGEVRDGDLFGWEQARVSGAYRLIITEGLEDAVAVKQIHRVYGDKNYQPAVVSLLNGSNSVHKALARQAKDIKRIFKEVILCFDNDEVGHKATEKALSLLPDAKVVVLPSKDANQCLMDGYAKAAMKAFAFEAKVPDNISIIDAIDLYEENMKPTPWGELSWPFNKLNEELRGLRYGETIYLGSGVKMGKSDLVDYLTAHFIKECGVSVLAFKLEDNINGAFKGILGKFVGSIFTDPKKEFDFGKYKQAKKYVESKKLYLSNKYQAADWENIKTNIIYGVHHNDVKVVFVDPITSLTIGMDSASANTELGKIAQEAAILVADLNIVIIFTCHLKTPEGYVAKETREKNYSKSHYIGLGNCPHEMGGNVSSTQFTGSRSMMRSCHLMLGWEGNKDPELSDDVKKLRVLSILEDRNFGSNARINLYRSSDTGLYKEL